MKGRRRARRSALQALYELDQSTHELSAVLDYRVDEFYRSAGTGAMLPSDWDLVEAVIERWPHGEIDATQAAALSVSGSASLQRVELASEFVQRWAPHALFLHDIVRGVWSNRVILDQAIARIAPEWPIDQMAPVDRNVLRIALWEIGTDTTPQRVAISEAVELARLYSGDGARRMVNGALGTYALTSSPKVTLDPDEDALQDGTLQDGRT